MPPVEGRGSDGSHSSPSSEVLSDDSTSSDDSVSITRGTGPPAAPPPPPPAVAAMVERKSISQQSAANTVLKQRQKQLKKTEALEATDSQFQIVSYDEEGTVGKRVRLPSVSACATEKKEMRIVVVSDTHNRPERVALPPGDILIHCGDFTDYRDWRSWKTKHFGDNKAENLYLCSTDQKHKQVAKDSLLQGLPEELSAFNTWLGSLVGQFKYRIVISGNHEIGLHSLTRSQVRAILSNATHYLVDETVSIGGLTFHGSPWTGGSMAFGAKSDLRKEKWAKIPRNVDVLITHQPPLNVLDLAFVGASKAKREPCNICGDGNTHFAYRHWGCDELLARVKHVKPRVHVFGHVHDTTGAVRFRSKEAGAIPSGDVCNTTFVNAAVDIKLYAYYFDISPNNNDNGDQNGESFSASESGRGRNAGDEVASSAAGKSKNVDKRSKDSKDKACALQ